MDNESACSGNGETQADGVTESRRDALRKIGRYGAVTAPVLLGLLTADKAFAQSVIGEPITGTCTVSPPTCQFT